MKSKFEVGNYIWGVRQRGRDDWMEPSEMLVTDLKPTCVVGKISNIHYCFQI